MPAGIIFYSSFVSFEGGVWASRGQLYADGSGLSGNCDIAVSFEAFAGGKEASIAM